MGNQKIVFEFMQNRNISNFPEILYKIEKRDQNNADSMHFDCEAIAIVPGRQGLIKGKENMEKVGW